MKILQEWEPHPDTDNYAGCYVSYMGSRGENEDRLVATPGTFEVHYGSFSCLADAGGVEEAKRAAVSFVLALFAWSRKFSKQESSRNPDAKKRSRKKSRGHDPEESHGSTGDQTGAV